MCIFGCREPHCDLEASGVMGVGPVHTLPSTCLQKVEEQPEDADNQRNVTRMGSQPPDPSTAVQVPVTLTGPPGETTVVPSEYLPGPAGQGLPCSGHFASSSLLFHGSGLGTGGLCDLFPQLERNSFAVSICTLISLAFRCPKELYYNFVLHSPHCQKHLQVTS